jgi:hypothetical protein
MAETLVLAALVPLMVSCASWRTRDIRTLTGPLPENAEVLSVLKNSGEAVLFSKSDPGRLRGYAIVGVARVGEPKRIELSGPFRIMKDAKERVYEVTDGKGQAYAVERVLEQSADRMTVLASIRAPVSIPLADVRRIELKKSNALRNVAIVSAALVAAALLPFLLPAIF